MLGSRGAPAACLKWDQGLCVAGMWCCPMSDQLRTALYTLQTPQQKEQVFIEQMIIASLPLLI